MHSKYEYVATVRRFGHESVVTAPSIRQLAKDLSLCHLTARKLVNGNPNCRWREYITVEKRPKGSETAT